MSYLRPICVGLAATALCGVAQAQIASTSTVDAATLLQPTGALLAPGVQVLEPQLEGVRDLAGLDRVVLRNFPMAGGATVDLELDQVDLDSLRFGFQVDGEPVPGLLEGLDLSVWTGTILGTDGSEAVVSFSNRGVRGWVTDGATLSHLLPEPGPSNDWSRSEVWLTSEQGLRELGVENDFQCGLEGIDPEITPTFGRSEGETAFAGASCQVRECPIAIETDYQLNQVFGGDLAAETAHISSLLAAGSARYQEQIDTFLTYPYVQFYTTSNDPWSTPDSGGGSITMLNEFVSAWSGNVPAGAILGHFLSGANLGGGVAYLDAICDTSQSFSFAVSGNMDGQTQFPITVNPFNWEFIVFTHETGHNFGSPHTHDYSPQIDNCAGGNCISNGTVMSYCHLCPGGMNNMTTFFHPTVVNLMKGVADNCLPLYVGIDAQQLTLIAPDVPNTVTANVQGSPTGAVSLNYRFSAGAGFQQVTMADLGNGQFSGDLPAAPCGSTPEYFVSFDDAACGFASSPSYFPEVGVETIVFTDDFESANGWSVGAPGDSATTGVWERANPQSTPAQPGDDVTPTGTLCFVTDASAGSGVGSFDIDGGATTLTSPNIDLSSGDARIGYWRWYSNDEGASPNADVFRVDISNNGGSSWTSVEVVGPTGPQASGGWFFYEFLVSDVIAPTGSMRMRFIAADEGSGSIVEAAIDDFAVRRVDCTVCQTDLGFGGPGDLALELCGDALTANGSADLQVTNADTNGAVWVLAGTVNNPVPFAGGQIVPNPQLLIQGLAADVTGTATIAGIQGGTASPVTLFLQAIALDLGLPGQFEISNAVSAEFLP